MNHTFTIIPLTIEARGEVISSNINEFRELVQAALGTINRDLQTDEQFGQAEIDAKALKDAEDAVKMAKDKALADAQSLHALFVAMDETSDEIRKARLDLETQIKKRKEEIKAEIAEEFLAAFDIDPKLARKHFLTGLQTQIKGKRTVESMKTAGRIYQTTQQAMINKCRECLASFEKAHGPELIMDRRELELEKPEGLEAELRRRFESKRAADERKRLEDEAATARAAEAKAKADLEASKQPPATESLPEPPKRIMESPWDRDGKAKVPAPERLVVKTEAEEWQEMTATVFESFARIKAHRECLTFENNQDRMKRFGQGVNALWKSITTLEAVK